MDEELLKKFKKVVEYFSKTSTIDILHHYRHVFEGGLHDLSQKSEFSRFLESYRDSTQGAVNMTDFNEKLKRISSEKLDFLNIIDLINRIRTASAKILTNLNNLNNEHISLVSSIIYSAEQIGLLNRFDSNFDHHKLIMFLKIINYDFNYLNNELIYVKKFTYQKGNYHGMEENLKDYIMKGNDIVHDSSFKDSPMEKLEQMIKDPVKASSFIRDPENRRGRIEFERTFIALVAPSLCGKTQSAFTMREIRPLYFALNESSFEKPDKPQPIYANFDSLNRMIEKVSIADLENIIEKLKIEDVAKIDYSLISSYNLFNNYCDQKFFTLGFLIALIEEAEAKYDPNADSDLIPDTKKSWMEFHAQRNGDRSELFFKAVSIDEAIQKNHLFQKYFMFLDEFSGIPWCVLVRNLCRAVCMRVLVANTDSNIANLTGRTHVSSSRGSGINEVWSIVVVRLNKSYMKASDRKHKILLRKIEEIVQYCHEEEREAVRLFFDDFIKNQFFKLRPGVLDLVREIILNFSTQRQSESAHYIIDTIIRDLGIELVTWKSRINSRAHGRLANLGLYLRDAYYDVTKHNIPINNPIGKDELFHNSSYLMDHLYYLKNPVDNEDWMFLAFYPDPAESKNLRIHHKNHLRPWIMDYTYFDLDEVLTIFACMTIGSPNSVINDLIEGMLISASGSINMSRSQNPEALKLDGNRLEVLAAVSIIEASHHDYKVRDTTLIGQNFFNFSCNIALNLMEYTKFESEIVFYESENNFNLKVFLSKFKVPFLFAANCSVPGIFEKMTQLNVVKVGSCNRTPDKEQIDFKFEIFSESENDNNLFCVAECKNLFDPISSTELIEIIQKAYNSKNNFISLIFCNSLKEFTVLDFKKLWNASKKGEVNIFKLEKVVADTPIFNWAPIAGDHINPEMIVLIYELRVLNNY